MISDIRFQPLFLFDDVLNVIDVRVLPDSLVRVLTPFTSIDNGHLTAALTLSYFLFLSSLLSALTRKGSTLVPTLFGLLWVVVGGPLAPFGVLLAFTLLFIQRGFLEQVPGAFRTVLLLLFVLSLCVIPSVHFDYPTDARVTPISPLLMERDPILVGPSLEISTANWQAYTRERIAETLRFAGLFTICSAVAIAAARLRFAFFSIAVWFLLFAETFIDLPRRYLPFEVLRRTIPGLGLIETPWAIAPIVLCALFCALAGGKGSRGSGAVRALFGLVAILTLAWNPTHRVHLISTFPLHPNMTPSRYVMEHKSLTDDSLRHATMNRLVFGRDLNLVAKASVHPDTSMLAIDGQLDTRWSTGRAQRKGDAFTLQFDRPVQVDRIVLRLGSYSSDFPRGLRVTAPQDGGKSQVLFAEENWQGGISWTPSGYPYFLGQNRVIIDLLKSVPSHSLMIEQIGSNDAFDWSIAEIELYARGKEGDRGPRDRNPASSSDARATKAAR